MDGNIIPYAAWAGNVVFLGVGVWLIKSDLTKTRSEMKTSIKDLYDALHKHKHRGLNGNDNDVIRGD